MYEPPLVRSAAGLESAPMPESLTVDVAGKTTTAVAYQADGNRRMRATLVLAHGAGAGQTSRFIVHFAAGLATRGIDTLTFNFLYSEHKRKAPDRHELLEGCYRAVVEAARSHPPLAANRVFIGGKSMGGRIASHLAASDGAGADLSGLVLLGYPLHPPGKPAQLRVAHLPAIRVPVLVVQGERDPFGTPEELQPHIASIAAPVTVHVVNRGDHSLAPPKRGGLSVDQVYNEVQDVIASWMATR